MVNTMLGKLSLAFTLACWLVAVPSQPLCAQPQDPDEEQLPAILKAKPVKVAPADDELRKLLKERYNAAVDDMRTRLQEYVSGRITLESLSAVAERLRDAALELYDKPAERVSLLTNMLAFARHVEKFNEGRFDSGRISGGELAHTRYLRVDAEIRLLRAKRQAEKAPKPK